MSNNASPGSINDPVEVVGRAAEAELLEACLLSGAHVLLEGPPGTGKSTLLRQVAGGRSIPFVMVEGNAELTPARLIGYFDPALVLSKGYSADIFADGPLLQAMRSGGLLYVEELNRIPEETLNVLLTAMSELEITVPRLGRVVAAPGFVLIAAMNPFDAVGTARVSGALYDRTCRISMGYQTAEAEASIIGFRTVSVDPDWRALVVDLVRRTRDHDDISRGSSVRGAIDIVRLCVELGRLRATSNEDWHVGLLAAKTSLSGRIRLQDGCDRVAEEVVTELYIAVFGAEPRDDPESDDDPLSPDGVSGETLDPPPGKPEARSRDSAPRTTGRSELSQNSAFAELSPEVGTLDLEALDDNLQSDPDATLTLLIEMSHATDEKLRSAVRRLAPRLILDQTRRGIPRNRGVAKRQLVPAHRGGDIDLDRSMDAIVESRAVGRMPSLTDLTASEWSRPDLALCLVIDQSGSMNGARLTTAAVAGAACLTYSPQEHAVLAFASTTSVLKKVAQKAEPTRTIERILGLRGHGTTGLAGALREARVQLAGSRARRRVVLLLSDCRVTDGVDATPAARAIDELVILAPDSDDEEALRFALSSGARIATIGSVLDVPDALNTMLADDRT